MQDMASRLPELDDKALATLQDNAERLSRLGSEAQRKAAESLLPVLKAEIASRAKARVPTRKATARRK